jgi:hypothetical protein
MTLKDDLAAALDTLPSEALERVLRAFEISEPHGEGQVAEELSDPLNAITDFLSEEHISSPRAPMAFASLLCSISITSCPIVKACPSTSTAAR